MLTVIQTLDETSIPAISSEQKTKLFSQEHNVVIISCARIYIFPIKICSFEIALGINASRQMSLNELLVHSTWSRSRFQYQGQYNLSCILTFTIFVPDVSAEHSLSPPNTVQPKRPEQIVFIF